MWPKTVSALLAVWIAACAPPNDERPPPVFDMRVPDEVCVPDARWFVACDPVWDVCPKAVATCGSAAGCIAAIADDAPRCMPRVRYADDLGTDDLRAPGRACASHAASVIAADAAGDVEPLLDAFEDAGASTRAVLSMALLRMRPDVVETIGRSRHPMVPTALLWSAVVERAAFVQPSVAQLQATARALDPEGASPYAALFQAKTEARKQLERRRRRHRRFEPWLARHAHAVLEVALRESYAWHADVRAELHAAIEANPDDALDSMREHLPCTAGREFADLVDMAASVPAQGRAAILREVLDWPDFHMQAEAAVALVGLGSADDLPALRRVASGHWSAPVRARARWAAATLAGEPAGKRPRDDFGDHGVAACAPDPDEPWHVRWRGAERVVPLRPNADPEPFDDAPRIRVENQPGTLVLPDQAHAIARLDPFWIYGVHLGEFGGGLYVVALDGTTTRLREDPVGAIVRTRRGLVATLGLRSPALVVLERDRTTGVRARHIVTLPGYPTGGLIEDPDGTLLIPTRHGVMAIDPTGKPSLLPCP